MRKLDWKYCLGLFCNLVQNLVANLGSIAVGSRSESRGKCTCLGSGPNFGVCPTLLSSFSIVDGLYPRLWRYLRFHLHPLRRSLRPGLLSPTDQNWARWLSRGNRAVCYYRPHHRHCLRRDPPSSDRTLRFGRKSTRSLILAPWTNYWCFPAPMQWLVRLPSRY